MISIKLFGVTLALIVLAMLTGTTATLKGRFIRNEIGGEPVPFGRIGPAFQNKGSIRIFFSHLAKRPRKEATKNNYR